MARHLVATGQLIDEEPALALEHALAARRLAARIAPVREAVGLAAYRAGEWQTAIAELRTYHRMTGRQTHLAVIGDCERALGRPERAIDLYRGADRESLGQAEAIELLIVAAGARNDMGQGDAAVAMLQVRELTAGSVEPWTPRLRYAYADSLLAVNRRDEAREWFSRAADADEFGETDAAERLLELDGVVLEGDEEDDDEATESAHDEATESAHDEEDLAADVDDTVATEAASDEDDDLDEDRDADAERPNPKSSATEADSPGLSSSEVGVSAVATAGSEESAGAGQAGEATSENAPAEAAAVGTEPEAVRPVDDAVRTGPDEAETVQPGRTDLADEGPDDVPGSAPSDSSVR